MKIVVGFTGAAESWAALGWATDAAVQTGGELFIVTSLTTGQAPKVEEEQALAYREALERAEHQLESAGVPYTIRKFALEGYSPSDSINRVAAEEKANMIVIGIRRRSKTGKLLLGSNALDILADADCPVVAVKATVDGTLPTF